ncbi:hypothetical protein G6L30_19660 [Agrobacterium rhizogenes]|nr:hypothetical protein [Rhizobium rhizogenes]
MADVDIPYRVTSAMKFMSKVNPGENCRAANVPPLNGEGRAFKLSRVSAAYSAET